MERATSQSGDGEQPRVIGLTGGTGVGKTTVGALLASQGAHVVDCDQLGYNVVAPGGAALPALFARFGPSVETDDGALDRAGLAAIVFTDADALADLNRITHPAIDDLIRSEIEAAAANGTAVVVLDMAVLVESDLGAGQYDTVLVVTSDLELRLTRLAERGMERTDAVARIASQASDEDRLAVADLVIDNSGSLEDLSRHVDDAWERLSV
jgi:dephospho-CoA kinase